MACIQFNTPTIYSGTKFENVRLEFDDGKIVKRPPTIRKRLNEILDTDAGRATSASSRWASIRYILNPMCDILFDEKIAGSLHFTPGQAYEDATTATARPFTGTWSSSSVPNGAAAKSGSMVN